MKDNMPKEESIFNYPVNYFYNQRGQFIY